MRRDREALESVVRHLTLQLHDSLWLEMFGDELAEREKYRSICGMDAVHLYLVRKFSWTLCQVRAMSCKDLLLILQEEMENWKPPKDLGSLFPEFGKPRG